MVHQRTLTITEQERAALEAERDHSPKPQVRERCAALLKIASGQSPHWVALHGLLKPRDPDTIYQWLDLYEQAGLSGLVERLHGGVRRGVP